MMQGEAALSEKFVENEKNADLMESHISSPKMKLRSFRIRNEIIWLRFEKHSHYQGCTEKLCVSHQIVNFRI